MSGYYPAGAEHDSNAPYNEAEPETYEAEYKCCAVMTKKNVSVVMKDLDSCKVEEEYHKQHYSISEMLNDYIGMLSAELEKIKTTRPAGYLYKMYELKSKITEASGWSEELEFD